MAGRFVTALVVAVASSGLGCVIASCSSFSSDSVAPATTDGGAEAPAACSPDLTRDPSNCGACGVVCPATAACENGACRPGCADKKVYVSTTGDDASDGCAIGRPMKTIGAAVARVKAIGAQDHEVSVCRGAYRERALAIDFSVSLRGGYECSQFTRTKDFGYPLFDAATETIIDDGNEGDDRATLTVKGAAVSRSTVVDGFTINGATTGAARSAAVAVQDGAAVTLTDLQIEGGGTVAATGTGSTGIHASASSPEIRRSVIRGGTGTASDLTNADVIGIHATGGAPYLHDLKASAASNVYRPRSYGVLLDGSADATGANAWHDVTFSGGQASTALVGLFVAGAHLEMSRGFVSGGKTNCQTAGCGAFGALMIAAVTAIESSRFYGGEIEGPIASGFAPSVFGLYHDGFTGPASVFANNVIVPGNSARRAEPRVVGAIFSRAPSTRFVHNTVILSEASGGVAKDTVAVWATYGSTNIELDDNLFVGENATTSLGVHLDRDCSGAPTSSIKDLRGNAFVGIARLLDAYAAGTPCAYFTAATFADAAPLLPDATFAKNVRYATNCGNDTVGPSCRPCNPGSTCAPLAIAPWTAGSPNSAELFAAPGYAMPANAPCVLARGAVDLTPKVMVDASGAPRPSPASIGASQIPASGACSP